MTIFTRPWTRGAALTLAIVLVSSACNRGRHKGEIAYVSAPQVSLRDHVAAVYERVGTVKNADRVEILDRDRRFALVRTASGAQGWMEQRYLVTQKVFDGFQKLAQEQQNSPVQATALTRNETNLHIEPGRDTEHLYQLAQGAKLSVLTRATAEKRLPGAPAKSGGDDSTPKLLEDWWLVRDEQGHAGWVLGRMMDVDVPLDIAQYAEGQRIVAAFVLHQMQDGDRVVPEYLLLLTEPKDGMPFDFNQARVFSWNMKRHRYETAYRERLRGVLPAITSQETFDKEAMLPVFVLRSKDEAGNIAERKYKFNSPIVRRADLPPGKSR